MLCDTIMDQSRLVGNIMYHPAKKAHIHFVGIGGIGMSGIATILHAQGYIISGCDIDVDQANVKSLLKLGCAIHQGNNTPQCYDSRIDILVYSSALQESNPEIIEAQKRGIPTIGRALMLAELMRTKYSIAIAGSHGKTTTTSLISHILIEAHLDPTVIIGGHLKTISHNARLGTGNFLVAEADESDRSFLHLHSTLAVVTNIDFEHVETYKNLADVQQTFTHFLSNLPFYGKAIVCIDDQNVQDILPIPHIKTISYGLTSDADVYGADVTLNPDHSIFSVYKKHHIEPLGTISMHMLGRHNVLNALAACTLALELGISFEVISLALQTFKGIERRFSYHGTFCNAEIFDDYGHHPNEIKHTVTIARNRAKNRLFVVFQPHRHLRTHTLWEQFIDVLSTHAIDHLIITDIHSAGETPIEGASSKDMCEALRTRNPEQAVTYIPYQKNFTGIPEYLEQTLAPHDLVLFLGAGSINKLAQMLASIE